MTEDAEIEVRLVGSGWSWEGDEVREGIRQDGLRWGRGMGREARRMHGDGEKMEGSRAGSSVWVR